MPEQQLHSRWRAALTRNGLAPLTPHPVQPNYYQNKNGKSFNEYIGCCFASDWNWHAATMACPNPSSPMDAACRTSAFAGPAWGRHSVLTRGLLGASLGWV